MQKTTTWFLRNWNIGRKWVNDRCLVWQIILPEEIFVNFDT